MLGIQSLPPGLLVFGFAFGVLLLFGGFVLRVCAHVCMHECRCLWMPEEDLLELELQVFVSHPTWILEVEQWSARTASALNLRHLSRPCLLLFCVLALHIHKVSQSTEVLSADLLK